MAGVGWSVWGDKVSIGILRSSWLWKYDYWFAILQFSFIFSAAFLVFRGLLPKEDGFKTETKKYMEINKHSFDVRMMKRKWRRRKRKFNFLSSNVAFQTRLRVWSLADIDLISFSLSNSLSLSLMPWMFHISTSRRFQLRFKFSIIVFL